jgi:hypothetical protein
MVLVYKHVVPNGTKSGKAFPHIKRLSRKEKITAQLAEWPAPEPDNLSTGPLPFGW